jgi:hypothetical protein
MNADVLFNIAGFCDIDTRRLMGMGPQQLKRNVELDAKLQALHAMLQIKWDERRKYHRIQLNDQISMLVCCPQQTSISMIDHYYTTVAGHYQGTCHFHTHGIGPSNRTDIKSHVYLDELLYRGSELVMAYFENGKWNVKQERNPWSGDLHPAPSDYPVLARLGYGLVE